MQLGMKAKIETLDTEDERKEEKAGTVPEECIPIKEHTAEEGYLDVEDTQRRNQS